ncbi:MAG: ABC transporter ATP-binding protein [bacterium]
MDPIFRVRNLRFKYDESWVLDGLSFEVREGEILGIIGPNGSGKTTILRILSRVLIPQEGEVYIKGKNLLELGPKEIGQIIGVVPQDTHFPFPFTVGEVVLMGRSPWLSGFGFESDGDLQIASQAMALTNTLSFSNRLIFELSGGERQRAIIARGLAQKPEVMLLDEPTAYLDIGHQIEIYDLIKKLNAEKKLTLIIVSHDLNLASEYCGRLILLDAGRIYKMGSPKEVITEKNLSKVYQSKVLVEENPVTGAPRITLLSKLMSRKYREKRLVAHIISGGGSGVDLMRKLVIEGYKVTCGVLNIGDADELACDSLGIEVVREEPFSPISEEGLIKNRSMIGKADLVIIERTKFGKGNIKNLEVLLEFPEKPIIVLENDKFDYTGGKAAHIYEELKSRGAVVVRNHSEVIEYLEEGFQIGKERINSALHGRWKR